MTFWRLVVALFVGAVSVAAVIGMTYIGKPAWRPAIRQLLKRSVPFLIMLVAVALLAVLWSAVDSFESPSPLTVSLWSWKYWLFGAVLLVGLLYLCTFVEDKNRRKFLQTSVSWVFGILFLGIPIFYGTWHAFVPSRICKNAPSKHAEHGCGVNVAWSYWLLPAEGADDAGLTLCWGPRSLVELDWRVEGGNIMYRFRAKSGEAEARYLLADVKKGGTCPELHFSPHYASR